MESLPACCLEKHLSSICPLLEGLKIINDFISDATKTHQSTYTLTQQAYAEALNISLVEFYQELSGFETHLIEQNVTTTLTDLLPILAKWKVVILTLSEIQTTINQQPIAVENHVRATCILSLLFTRAQHAQVTSYQILYPVLLRVFFNSLAPYLNIIDRWLTRGEIVDPFQEFIITRNESTSAQDENYWSNSVVRKTGHHPVDFMEMLMEDILTAGRSVELLNQVGQLSHFVRRTNVQSSKLCDIFAERFDSFCCNVNIVPPAASISPPPPLAKYESDNPLLNDAHALIYQSLTPEKSDKIARDLQTPEEFYPLLPLLEQSLKHPVRAKQRLVCRALLDVIDDPFAFRTHLLNLRRIHLMHAGDLMGRFCLQFFKKVTH